MENIELLLGGFSTLFTFSNIGAAMLGAVLGLIVGAMPGIGSLAGVALLLPLTYKFNPPLQSSCWGRSIIPICTAAHSAPSC